MKGKDPLLSLRLKKADRNEDLALELDLRSGTEFLGLVDIHHFGQYQASVPLGEFQP